MSEGELEQNQHSDLQYCIVIDRERWKNVKEEEYLGMELIEDRKMGSNVEWRIVVTCRWCVQRGKHIRAEEIVGN